MSKIHYFQRFSNRENTVTNNTLQLLARVYDYSPLRFAALLSELTGEALDVGIEINQQRKGGGNSVPDAMIIQRSLKIVVEAKIDASVRVIQLDEHAKSFAEEKQKILLLLTKRKEAVDSEPIKKRGIIFVNITYADICNAVGGMFKEHEPQMRELAEDYIAYCEAEELFDESKNLMRVVPCGHTWSLNLRYGMYFHYKDCSYRTHHYVGIYNDKTVKAVLEIDAIVDVEYTDGIHKQTVIWGGKKCAEKYEHSIPKMIDDAVRECGYGVADERRFFCGKLVETDYRKITRGGIQGHRYFNLEHVIPEGFSGVADIAAKLKKKTWE